MINTLNEKLDLNITLRDIERTHRIGESKKTTGKTRPIIEKLVLLLKNLSDITIEIEYLEIRGS